MVPLLLLDALLDSTIQDNEGLTPLDYALRLNLEEIAQLLFKHQEQLILGTFMWTNP